MKSLIAGCHHVRGGKKKGELWGQMRKAGRECCFVEKRKVGRKNIVNQGVVWSVHMWVVWFVWGMGVE